MGLYFFLRSVLHLFLLGETKANLIILAAKCMGLISIVSSEVESPALRRICKRLKPQSRQAMWRPVRSQDWVRIETENGGKYAVYLGKYFRADYGHVYTWFCTLDHGVCQVMNSSQRSLLIELCAEVGDGMKG